MHSGAVQVTYAIKFLPNEKYNHLLITYLPFLVLTSSQLYTMQYSQFRYPRLAGLMLYWFVDHVGFSLKYVVAAI